MIDFKALLTSEQLAYFADNGADANERLNSMIEQYSNIDKKRRADGYANDLMALDVKDQEPILAQVATLKGKAVATPTP